MKVFKFGGASVNSAEGVKNLKHIVETVLKEDVELFLIISAMGKTTNALEAVTEHFMNGRSQQAIEELKLSENYHFQIIDDLFDNKAKPKKVIALFDELKEILSGSIPPIEKYDRWYDNIVSYGELLSTTIIAEYFTKCDINNKLLDMRQCFITDKRHRDANIDIKASTPKLKRKIKSKSNNLYIGQGFIGSTTSGRPTTIGREGSDYSAAVVAHILDAESMTIWKDVEGILNADPKIFPEAQYIPEMTYLEAIELAYSGAQIIHPQTIKPLQNKNIPLYVRPFGDITKPGSVIKDKIENKIDLPILTLKHNQVLVTIRPKDFSFVLEDRFAAIFALLEQYRVKINLIQSSAVNLSLSIDNSRHIPTVVEKLKEDGYRVVYNTEMELLTIRGYTKKFHEKYETMPNVYLTQRTRRVVRVVRKVQ